MPQLQNLVLTDRKATPVAHTFVPRDIEGRSAQVVEAGATPIGDNVVIITHNTTKNGRRTINVRLVLPVVATETINGISSPKLLRTAYAKAEFNFAPDSTEAERNDAVGMFADAMGTGKALINDTVVKLQGIY
jgi:hypothetical protein